MNILHFVTLAATAALRAVVMGTAFIGLIVVAGLAIAETTDILRRK